MPMSYNDPIKCWKCGQPVRYYRMNFGKRGWGWKQKYISAPVKHLVLRGKHFQRCAGSEVPARSRPYPPLPPGPAALRRAIFQAQLERRYAAHIAAFAARANGKD